MDEILNSELFILTLTIASYYAGNAIIRYSKIKYLSGLLIAIVIVVSAVTLLRIDYGVYEQGSRMLNFMLAPSVVALGYVLHKNIVAIQENLMAITIGVVVGVVVNVVVINATMSLLGADMLNIYSVQPKSVTTPIAISLSQGSGAITSLTVMSVILTGLFGSIVGVGLLKLVGVKSPVAVGVALGSASHAIGTARALEIGPTEGAVSGLAIGLTGIITALLLPWISGILL